MIDSINPASPVGYSRSNVVGVQLSIAGTYWGRGHLCVHIWTEYHPSQTAKFGPGRSLSLQPSAPIVATCLFMQHCLLLSSPRTSAEFSS